MDADEDVIGLLGVTENPEAGLHCWYTGNVCDAASVRLNQVVGGVSIVGRKIVSFSFSDFYEQWRDDSFISQGRTGSSCDFACVGYCFISL